MPFRGSWNRDNPRLPGEQPRERDLRWRRLLPLRERRQPRDEGEVRAAVLLRKTRNGVAEIGRVKGGSGVDLSRQEAFTQRAERHEPDPELLERGQDLLLRLAPPQ